MSSPLAALGILLVLIAIPLGMMLAPLVIGAILIALGVRHLGRSLDSIEGVPA